MNKNSKNNKMKSKRKKCVTTKHTHLKNVNNSLKTVKFSEIKEPSNVDEFRSNLLKYYYSVGGFIYVQELGMVDVKKINTINDLVDMVQIKYPSKSPRINLTPKVVELINWKKYVNESSNLSYYQRIDTLQRWWDMSGTHSIILNNDNFLRISQQKMGGVFWKNILEKKELYQYFHNKVMGKFGIYDDFEQDKPFNHLTLGTINIGGFGDFKITYGGFLTEK